MENKSRMEAMKNRFMELSSLGKKEAMASLKSPKRRGRMVKVTAHWCGPQRLDHFSPTFWDHSSSRIQIQIQIQMDNKSANHPSLSWTSYGPPSSFYTQLVKPKQEEGIFSLSPMHLNPGRFSLPKANSNKKKMENPSKVFACVTLKVKGANQNPAKHAEEGSGQVPCKKKGSLFEEAKMGVKGKGMDREEERHTKRKRWIPNPHQEPSKIR